MSPSSNSVYSSVFMYNPYVLTRPYRHFTFVASIGPHRIMWISHNNNVSILGFRDNTHACSMNTTTSHQKLTCHPSTRVSWLFDKLSVTHSSLSASHHSATSCDIPLCSNIQYKNVWKWTVRSMQDYEYNLPFVTVWIICFTCSF